jgi:hypothetical protein
VLIVRRRRLAHPPESVVAMLLDTDAHVATYEHMGHRDVRLLRAHREPDALEVAIVRRVDVEVPAAARRFVHPTNTVTSEDRWERTAPDRCTGRSDVTIAGLPVGSVGRATVAPARHAEGGGGRSRATDYEISLALDIRIPIVGPRVARLMRGQLERQIDAQFDATESWLAAHG